MPAPQTVTAAVSADVAASGSYQLPDADAGAYDQVDFLCTVAGGTASFVAKQWVTAARPVDCTGTLAAQSQCTISANQGPYPHLGIYWSGNTGTITIDVAYKRHSTQG